MRDLQCVYFRCVTIRRISHSYGSDDHEFDFLFVFGARANKNNIVNSKISTKKKFYSIKRNILFTIKCE